MYQSIVTYFFEVWLCSMPNKSKVIFEETKTFLVNVSEIFFDLYHSLSPKTLSIFYDAREHSFVSIYEHISFRLRNKMKN
jgi:hypothetical protein